jgi:MoaA/NifB/PqqE/SkfB family radical SAM enzyme
LDLLVVSVDGPKEVHNQIRGGKVFERLSAGIETILAQPSRPITFVSMAISDLNYDQLIPMYELALSWGVDGINYNHLWMQTHETVEAMSNQFSILAADDVTWDIHPEEVDTEQLAMQLATIRQRTRFSHLIVTQTPDLSWNDIGLWYRQPERFVKYNSTRCAWTRMKVWPDGNVKPCREWVAGDVSQEHAMQVWNGEKFREFRRLLARHGTLPICSRCCYMAHR